MKKKSMATLVLVLLLLVQCIVPMTAMAAAAACAHDWKEVNVLKEADCKKGTTGIAKEQCTKCKETQYVSYAGHDWAVDFKDADCENPVMYGEICTICEEAKGELKPLNGSKPLGHDIKAEPVKADCENPAGVRETCSRCDYSKLVPLTGDLAEPAKGHTPKAVEDEPATCKNKGWTGKVVCSVCDKELEKGTELPIDKDAHVAKIVKTLKAGDCKTNTNGIAKMVCELCGADMGYSAIPAEHSYEEEIIEAATCGKDGSKNQKCTVCGHEEKKVPIPATGEHNFEETTKDATCTEPAMVGQICTVCKATDGEPEIVKGSKPLGHDIKEDVVEADCENPAGVRETCSRCDYDNVVPFTGDLAEPAKGHTPKAEEDVPATCKKPGWTGKVVCSVCDKEIEKGTELPIDKDAHVAKVEKMLKDGDCKTNTSGIAKMVCELCGADMGYSATAAEHSYVDEIIKAATCGEAGSKNQKCSVCGHEEKEVEIPATGEHNFEETTKDATCTEPAMVGQICTVCGAADGELTPVKGSEPLGHKITEDVKEADCENTAGVLEKCSECDYSKFVPLTGDLAEPAKGHTAKAVEDVPATCKKAGWTGKVICSICEKVLEKGEELPIDENAHHAVVDKPLRDGDCKTNTSGIAKMVCELCGADMGYNAIPAEHSYEEEIIEAATCDKAGSKNQKCTVCGHEEKEVEIPATGEHSFEETTKDATCTEPAKVGEFCAVCGAANGEPETVKGSKPLGHDWEENHVDATCTQPAGVQKTCKRCGEEEFVEYTGELAAPALGHKEEAEDIPATCSTTGRTGRVICTVCGETLAEGEEVPADENAHVPTESKIVKEATCTTPGTRKMVCEECDAELGYEAFYAEHNWSEEMVNEDATCVYRECLDCGETEILQTFEGFDQCEEQGHTAGEPVVENEVAATCTAEGSRDVVVYCTVCKAEISRTSETIEKLAHKYVDGFCEVCHAEDPDHTSEHTHDYAATVTAPTCTEEGYTTYTCACGDSYVDNKVPALGHTAVSANNAVAATCTADGKEADTVCSTCGATIQAGAAIPATGHHHEAVSVKEPTCTEGGYTTYQCACGDSYNGNETPAAGHKYTHKWIFDDDITTKTKVYTCSVCGHSYSDAPIPVE